MKSAGARLLVGRGIVVGIAVGIMLGIWVCVMVTDCDCGAVDAVAVFERVGLPVGGCMEIVVKEGFGFSTVCVGGSEDEIITGADEAGNPGVILSVLVSVNRVGVKVSEVPACDVVGS